MREFCAISRYQISNKRVNIVSEIQRFVRSTCQAFGLCQLLSNRVQLQRLTKYQQLSYNTNDIHEKGGKFCALEYFDRSETLRISSRVIVLATYFSPSLSLRVTRYRDTVSRVYTLPRVLRLFARLHVLTLNLRCCNTVSVYKDSQPRQLKTVVGIKITSY